MSFTSKLSRSWQLAKICLGVLGGNKELLVFPVATFLLSIFVLFLCFVPLTLMPTGHAITEKAHWETVASQFFSSETRASASKPRVHEGDFAFVDVPRQGKSTVLRFGYPWGWAYWACLYLASMFAATFCNVAFYHEILAVLRGGSVSIGRGFSFAATKWKGILCWTLFAGVVGIIIKTIEEKSDLVGRWIASLIGSAWSIASIFVIPVLVENESPNPFESLKKSAQLLTRTWGETIIGYTGLVVGEMIVALVTFGAIVGSVAVGITLHSFWIPFVCIVSWLALLFAFGYVMGVASQIYRGALYIYASEQQLVNGFTPELMHSAWKQK
jgi:hypothetical protein